MGKLEVFRDGEFYLIQRDGFYHLYGTWDGKRIRRSCQTKDLVEAKLQLDNLKRECLSGWRAEYDDPATDWRTVARLVHKRHRASARDRNMPFDLEPAQVYDLMQSTGFRCAVSGIPFSKYVAETAWRDPWAPSLDRIENRHGYIWENVRVVCQIANIAMNAWGYDTMLRMARGVVRSASSVSQEEEVARGVHTERAETAQVIDFKREDKT